MILVRVLALLLGLGSLASLAGQEAGSLTIRFDYRRSLEGRYRGLLYGEHRLSYLPGSDEDQGEILQFRLEDLLRDGRREARRVESGESAEYWRDEDGTLVFPSDSSVLVLRDFPSRPPETLQTGLVWRSSGTFLADPYREGRFTRIPLYTEYRTLGIQDYNGQEVWAVEALHALRYNGGDFQGDPRVRAARGRHQSVIYYSRETQRPVFARVTLEEDYDTEQGLMGHRGFLLLWFQEGVPFGEGQAPRDLVTRLEERGIPDVEVESLPEGLRLRLDNLLFVANEARLLPGEEQRLEALASLLVEAYPGRRILVSGHTARAGDLSLLPALSVARARRIVDELVARGLEPDRLMYEGLGFSRPLADDSTEEGRRQNRRVEILILEN